MAEPDFPENFLKSFAAEGKGKSGKPDVVEVICRQFEHGKERA